jgi:endonuclease YncB( thermonuclease family)
MFQRLFGCCFSSDEPQQSSGNLKRMATIDFPVIVEPLKDEWLDLAQAPDDLNAFTYEGLVLKGRVVRVLDGDTVQVIVLNDKKLESHRFRLLGIDAPELHPRKDSIFASEEKDAALKSKEMLEQKLAEDSNLCVITFTKDDKYGRRMGTLATRQGISINDWMVKKGYAVAYDGGKKQSYVAKAIDVVKKAFSEDDKKETEEQSQKKAAVEEQSQKKAAVEEQSQKKAPVEENKVEIEIVG